MDVYIKEGRVYGLLKNRKILKLTLDNQRTVLFWKIILTFGKQMFTIRNTFGLVSRIYRKKSNDRVK